MIGNLEKEWKIVLLERSKGGVKLTLDGLKLLPYAKSLVAEYEKLQMQVDELKRTAIRTAPYWYILKRCHSLAAEYHQRISKKIIRISITNFYSAIIRK